MSEGTKKESTGLIEFNKLDAGLSGLKKKYEVVPDFSDPQGYLDGKEALTTYRDYKRRTKDTHTMAKAEIKKELDKLNGLKLKIDQVLEDTFNPYRDAKKAEDDIEKEAAAARKAEKERRRKEIQDVFDELREVYAGAVGETSERIKFVLEFQKAAEYTEDQLGDRLSEGKALQSAMIGKLQGLYDSKKQNEEEEARIKKEREELDAAKEEQRIKDEAAAKLKSEQDEIEAENMRKENAELKAKNEVMEAKQKKFDEEKRQFEDDKRKAKEEQDRKDQYEVDRMIKEKQEQIEREKKLVKEAEEKKQREESEKKAKEEAGLRYDELLSELTMLFDANPKDLDKATSLIAVIENKNIPYLKLDWTTK